MTITKIVTLLLETIVIIYERLYYRSRIAIEELRRGIQHMLIQIYSDHQSLPPKRWEDTNDVILDCKSVKLLHWEKWHLATDGSRGNNKIAFEEKKLTRSTANHAKNPQKTENKNSYIYFSRKSRDPKDKLSLCKL